MRFHNTRRLVLAALCCIGSVADATASGPDFYCVKDVQKNDVLNVRTRPSLKSKVVTKIPHNACRIGNFGTCATEDGKVIPESDVPAVKDARPFWCKVRYEDKVGWVASRFLREDIGGP